MTKARQLRDDETVDVGDLVKVEHMGMQGYRVEKVVRVTKTMAVTQWKAAGRVMSSRYLRKPGHSLSRVPRSDWSTTSYSCWRPV